LELWDLWKSVALTKLMGGKRFNASFVIQRKKISFSRIKKKKIAKAALMKILMKIPLRIAVLQIKDIAIN
jgi:hypothetical protein